MAAWKKKLPGGERQDKSGQQPAKKPTPLGTDAALTVKTSEGKSIVLTYWDFWFALVAVKDHAADFGRLADRLKQGRSAFFVDSRAAEQKRCHLRDLGIRPGWFIG